MNGRNKKQTRTGRLERDRHTTRNSRGGVAVHPARRGHDHERILLDLRYSGDLHVLGGHDQLSSGFRVQWEYGQLVGEEFVYLPTGQDEASESLLAVELGSVCGSNPVHTVLGGGYWSEHLYTTQSLHSKSRLQHRELQSRRHGGEPYQRSFHSSDLRGGADILRYSRVDVDITPTDLSAERSGQRSLGEPVFVLGCDCVGCWYWSRWLQHSTRQIRGESGVLGVCVRLRVCRADGKPTYWELPVVDTSLLSQRGGDQQAEFQLCVGVRDTVHHTKHQGVGS